MPKITNVNSGIYLLEIFAPDNFTLSINKFNGYQMPAGWYYYVGSSQKSLPARLVRHISKSKSIHWHIDHLTSRSETILKKILVFPNRPKEFECELNNLIHQNFDTKYLVNGFGNSDCHTCTAHLSYSERSIINKIKNGSFALNSHYYESGKADMG